MKKQINSQSGQTLVEILVAITVAGILIGSAAALITVSLKSNIQNRNVQAATLLSQDLIEKVTVYAESRWVQLSNLPLYPAQNYLDNQAGSLVLVPNYITTSLTINNAVIPFKQYFIVERVIRYLCGTGKISSSAVETGPDSCDSNNYGSNSNDRQKQDYSTLKVTAFTTWNNDIQSVILVKFLTRNRNFVFRQSDWLGGPTVLPGTELPIAIITATTTTNRFAKSTNIDFTSRPGSIMITPP